MGWFSDLVFGKTANQIEGPTPKEYNVWGVDDEPVPNVAEQNVNAPEHDESPPEIHITRVEPHVSSDNKQLELWICLSNLSNNEAEITRIECFRQTTNPSRFLKSGENHELQIYRGPVMHTDTDTKMHVTYKSCVSGDYYLAEYLIKYKYTQHEDGGHYMPYEFDILKPVKKM